MTSVAHILTLIDTGLQTAGDTAYGNDWPGTCWRCGQAAEDLCDGCRVWLLDETEGDKVTRKSITVIVSLNTTAFQAAIDNLLIATCGQPSIGLIRRTIDEHIHITSEGTRSE